LTSTELLLEAVVYATETDTDWWETFDSKSEAIKMLSKARKERPDEHQIAELISCREEYVEDDMTVEDNYMYILKKLKKELTEKEE